MGLLEASFQLHSGSEGEDDNKVTGLGRRVIGRRVRVRQPKVLLVLGENSREWSLLCTGPVSVRRTAGSAADLLHPWLLG